MANWYCSSVAYTAVAAWSASTAVTVGQIVRQTNPAINNERCFRASNSGTTGTTEPSWNLGKNSTTNDNGITWVEVTGQEIYQAPGAWAAPHARLNAMVNWMAAGDFGYLSNDHAETQASTLNVLVVLNSAATPYNLVSVLRNSSSHIPPQAADYAPGASLTTTGASNINICNFNGAIGFLMGLVFNCGSGTSTTVIAFGNGASIARCRDCTFNLVGTGNGSFQAAMASCNEFENCNFTFSAVGQGFIFGSYARMRGGAIAATGVVPTTLFYSVGTQLGMTMEGVDLSAFGLGKTLFGNVGTAGRVVLKDCKLSTGVTVSAITTAAEIIVVRSSGNPVNYTEQKYDLYGTQTDELSIVHTGGASDGVTTKSRNISTNANASFLRPHEPLAITTWLAATGVAKTLTVEGIWNAAVLPKNDEIWLDVQYLGQTATPQGATSSGSKSSYLLAGSAQSASTEAWDSLVPTRANSTTYSVGQAIKTASNPGRVFFCTTAGQSAASEPAGYTNAVDGGSLSDGGAVFRAGVRFKLSNTFTAQMASPIVAYTRVGLKNATFYIDPKMTVS